MEDRLGMQIGAVEMCMPKRAPAAASPSRWGVSRSGRP